MSVKPLLALVVASTLATPAFSQTVDRCAANATFGLTRGECQQYGGTVNDARQCVLSDEALSRARDELCLNLPGNTNAPGTISPVAIFGAAALLAAVGGGGGSTNTTTSTTGTN